MISFIRKRSPFVFLIISFSVPYLFGTPATNLPELHFTYPEKKNTYGIRTGSTEPSLWQNLPTNQNIIARINLAHMSPTDFEQAFQNEPNKKDILNDYKLYAFSAFRAYARSLPCYNEFMLSLQEKINNDKKFRKRTAHVEGFKYSFSFWSEKSGFHDFVNTEANNIRNNLQATQQQRPAQIKKYYLNVDNQNELEALTQNWIERIHLQPEDFIKNRLIDRTNALRQTHNRPEERFDYSSQVPSTKANDKYAAVFKQTYGTALDCQLHKELCQTRNAMFELEHNFDKNYHVEIIAPAVHHLAAQAKTEQCASIAFQLADFSHALTQLVAKGLDIFYDFSSRAGKGVLKAAKNTLSLEHWQEMATGALQLGLSFFDAIGQEDARQNAVLTAAISKNYDAIPEFAQEHCLHTQAQKDAISHCAKETYEKIKAMSWQEIVENGTELGATMIFDTLALHTLNGFATKTSRAVAERISNAVEKGAPLAQQYALEVAGFGKLTVDDGVKVAQEAADFFKNNPELIMDRYKQVLAKPNIEKAATPATTSLWHSENIPLSAIYGEVKEIAPEIMPRQNLKHYFLGEIRTKKGRQKLLGFHHARSYPERIQEIIIPPDKFGIYHAKYIYEGLEKESTFFPDHWDRITVLKKINEAYRNPNKFYTGGLIGTTSEGIEIEMWFFKKESGEIIINSAYPKKDQLLHG
ncbi:EndoU domain-containing protein [Candidatus Babeliales bacterium]|nr:EndoU domain-containing protein [Candidatus Babeliales bacterium]